MKFFILSVLGLTLSAHAADVPSPENATIVPVKYSGSGCPLVSTDRRTSVVDVMWGTYDMNGTWNYALNLPPTMGPALWSDIDESYRVCVGYISNDSAEHPCTYFWRCGLTVPRYAPTSGSL